VIKIIYNLMDRENLIGKELTSRKSIGRKELIGRELMGRKALTGKKEKSGTAQATINDVCKAYSMPIHL
jgi:hypothetical protein